MHKRKGSNIREIARLAGVSVASVSRALDPNSNKVSAELQEKILNICDDLKYFPNMHTVRMFANRANNVAFIFPSYDSSHDDTTEGTMDPNMGSCITGAEEELSSRGIYLTLTSTTEKFIENKEYLKIARGKMVDGVIVWGWTEQDEYLIELAQEGIPVVVIQGKPECVKVSTVTANDHDGMKAIIDHVVSRGHRKIAVLRPPKSSFPGRQRLKGTLAALEDHGLSPCLLTETSGFGQSFGYKIGKEIISGDSGTTCIVAPNDTAAFGVIKAAKELGAGIPEDISVTGADGLKFTGITQLTTFLSPSYQIGVRGAQLLCDLIDDPKGDPCQELLPITFIKGETVNKIV